MNFKTPKLSLTLILFIGGQILSIIVILLLSILFKSFNINIRTSSQISLLIGSFIFVVPIFLWTLFKDVKIKDIFRFNRVGWRYILYSIVSGIGLILVLEEISIIIEIFIPIPAYLEKIEELLIITNFPSAFYLISSLVFIAPLVEEMVFRGFLQQSFEKNLKNINRAVVYTALVFMISHFNIYWALEIFIMGFFLSFVAWKTNSILVSIIIHLLTNSLSLLSVQYIEVIETFILFHGHLNPILFLGGLFLLVFFIRKLSRLENCT